MTTAELARQQDLSDTTRAAARAATIAAQCGCAGPPEVHVLRGFDSASRKRGRALRRRLRGTHGIFAGDDLVPVLAADAASEAGRHVCAYVDATDHAAEADRIAALHAVPIVMHDPAAGAWDTEQVLPILRAEFTATDEPVPHRTFPSAVGRVPQIAFDAFVVAPNQPERGELTTAYKDGFRHQLPVGSSVTVRAVPGAAFVEVIDPHGETRTWLTDRLEIRQKSGLHRILRDGLCIADLADTLRLEHVSEGLRRHLA